MAKNTDSTALSKAPDIQVGRAKDDAAFAEFVGDGFAQVETVIFGDESTGENKMSRYVGALIGYGTPIERIDSKTGEMQVQKTFAFHPLTRDGEKIVASTNVTHVIPASYMMAAACERILQQSKETGKQAIVGLLYRGQVNTRRGFRVNDIAVFEKYV